LRGENNASVSKTADERKSGCKKEIDKCKEDSFTSTEGKQLAGERGKIFDYGLEKPPHAVRQERLVRTEEPSVSNKWGLEKTNFETA